MPTRYYEYTCGHGRNIKSIRFESVRIDKPEGSYFNPYLSYQPQDRPSERSMSLQNHHPNVAAASALESLDRDTHARIAGRLGPERVLPITRIHSPGDHSGSRHPREGRSAEVVVSVEKSEKRSERKYYKNYPCGACRRSERMRMEGERRVTGWEREL